MKTFFNVQDLGPLQAALKEAEEVKANRFAYQQLGKNKTLLMIFFNNSLRTRLSTQKAAMNLGMNVIVLDVNAGAWKLETERGVIMDGDKSEHLLEAIPVMGCYCDIIAVRSFAGLSDRDYDYAETIVSQFVKYSGRPVVAMETATVHPLQAFADLITIHEKWTELNACPATKPAHKRPKVVLTWAPHCRALPQAVIEKDHHQRLVLSQMLIFESFLLNLLCFGQRFVQGADILNVYKCSHILQFIK